MIIQTADTGAVASTANEMTTTAESGAEISADDIEKGPSEHVLNNIFNYAKALRVVKLKQTADCNLVLN